MRDQSPTLHLSDWATYNLRHDGPLFIFDSIFLELSIVLLKPEKAAVIFDNIYFIIVSRISFSDFACLVAAAPIFFLALIFNNLIIEDS